MKWTWSAILLLFQCLAPAASASTALAPTATTPVIPPLPHDTCEADAQCLNGGHCIVFKRGQIKSGADDEYNYCTCHSGFGGQRCESYCPLQCLNGGVCHSKGFVGTTALDPRHPLSASYACKCLGHWTGTVCDMPYENCVDGSQCFRGGKCRERNETITVSYCECPPGLGGVSCQATAEEQLQEPEEEPVFTKKTLNTYISLGIVLAVTGSVGFAYILLRRRRGPSYSTVQISENCNDEIEVSNRGIKQDEQWRNVV